MEGKMDLKVCGVCGDKALGCNFNAITCESCKAFFRRNALIKKDFRCPFNEQCEITTVTRRFCQKCRLEKCFAIGMRKDYIMSEEDKFIKRKKIEENRAKKRTCPSDIKPGFKKVRKDMLQEDESSQEYILPETDFISSNEPSQVYSYKNGNSVSVINYPNVEVPRKYQDETSSLENLTSPEDFTASPNEDQMIRTMLNQTPNPKVPNNITSEEEDSTSTLGPYINNNDITCNHNTNKFKSTADTAKDILEEVQRIPIEANSIESILCEAIKLEFEAYTSLAHCHGSSRELNDAERAKLNELIVANKALLTPVDDDLSNLIGEDCRLKTRPSHALLTDPALLDVINLTAVAIRRLIKMAKKINAFKNMCQEDQVALLKGGCTEMMILRSCMNYDIMKHSWNIPHSQESLGSLKADVLKQAKGNIYQEHERFIRTFDAKWRSDENIILIMCAITLFTPDRPRVIHQDVIKLEQNSYYYLLRRYLESIYPGCEAKSTFLKLIQKISELHKLNAEVISCYLDVNPSDVEPLLIEIFDLKH